MLIKVWVENYHPKIVKIPDDYDFIIKKSFKDFTKEEIEKIEDFYPLLYDTMGISEEETNIEIDFEASRAGIEKEIDTAIKDWFCYNNEEWTEELKTITLDEAFARADLDYHELWNLIQWLRKHCD